MRMTRTDREAFDNVRKFEGELSGSSELQSRMGYVRAWYAVRDASGWLFGPSKFVGYSDTTAADYLKEADAGDRDGRDTERLLTRWFRQVDPRDVEYLELSDALEAFLARFNKTPNKLARLNVLRGEFGASRASKPIDLADRIVSDPRICSGRPCIRGTRIRVSDIVELVASGADRDEILRDFPNLSAADITAALIYAARCSDHRVIELA